jgi:hypothetical protein
MNFGNIAEITIAVVLADILFAILKSAYSDIKAQWDRISEDQKLLHEKTGNGGMYE